MLSAYDGPLYLRNIFYLLLLFGILFVTVLLVVYNIVITPFLTEYYAPPQFYDKFNIRHNIAELLEYLWQVPSHRNVWRRVKLSIFVLIFLLALIYVPMEPYVLILFLYQIAKEEEKGVYLNFLNFLINDSIYLLDESLNKILEIKELEAEMSNTVEWESRPAQERQERTRLFQSQENVSLHFHISLGLNFSFEY